MFGSLREENNFEHNSQITVIKRKRLFFQLSSVLFSVLIPCNSNDNYKSDVYQRKADNSDFS